MNDHDARSPSPGVTRAAAILGELALDPRVPLGPSELSRGLGIPKSTVLNICRALCDSQLLRRSSAGYSLGRRLAELGRAYVASVEEVEEFYGLCREWLGRVTETIQLAVLGDDLNCVYLARHDGLEPLHLGSASEIGRSVPAHCTAAGKALIASLDDAELEARLATAVPLRTLTDRSMTTPEAVRAEVDRTRSLGYASERDEVVPGLACLATTVGSPLGENCLLAVSFTFRTHAVDLGRVPEVVAQLKSFARELSDRIGSEEGQVA